LHCFFPFTFFLYVVDLIGRWYDIKKYKTILMLIPVIIFYVILFINPFTDFAFTFVDGEYKRGYGIYFEYAAAAFYMICGIYWIIKYRNAIGVKKTIDIILFLSLIITGVIIQLILPDIKVELFLTSVGLLSIGCNIENRDQVVNRITDCYNADTLLSDNEQYIRAGFKYRLYVINISNLNIVINYFGVNRLNAILNKIGTRLKGIIYKNDTVYYLNSGSFIFLTFDTYRDKSNEIIDALNTVTELADLNIGVAILKLSVPFMVSNVDEILNISKKINSKDNTIKVLDNSFIEKIKRETLVEKAIRYAINNNSFNVVYQPIVSTKTDRVHSLEALSRIIDPEIGFISPDEIINVAEETGLIYELSEKIFERVVSDISKGDFNKFNLDHVAINISRLELNRVDLPFNLKSITEKYGVDISFINLEITETHQSEDNTLLLKPFNRLKEIGFNFSLDDYGTGLSNISSIYEMDFNIVKIDKSILWNSVKSDGYKAILDSNIEILHNLKFKLVCEGVETKEQVDYLKNHNVEYIQGYYYSKPIGYDDLIEYLKIKNN
jgi:EAL domain-containing protein (putative c-di-GMP-specific phosphodiesterase class I)